MWFLIRGNLLYQVPTLTVSSCTIAYLTSFSRGANANFFSGGCALKGPSFFQEGPTFPKQILLPKRHDLMKMQLK